MFLQPRYILVYQCFTSRPAKNVPLLNEPRLEETHVLHPERLEKLLVLVAFAFCWAHRIGEWLVEATPVKVKKHGRLARSIFRTGFDHLRRILSSFKGIRQLKALKQVALILSCT